MYNPPAHIEQADPVEVLEMGKVMPQAVELEQAVLGAIMLDRDAMAIVAQEATPETFYSPKNRIVFEAMMALYTNLNPIDLLTVKNQLDKMGRSEEVEAPYYLVELTNRVASAANIQYHTRVLIQKQKQREIIELSTQAITKSFANEDDAFELLDWFQSKAFGISETHSANAPSASSEVGMKLLKELEEAAKSESHLVGLATLYSELDNLLGGLRKTDLIILAARPGMGKTAFVLNVVRNLAIMQNIPVAFFSLEMGKTQLAARLLSIESGVKSQKLKNPKEMTETDWNNFHTATERHAASPIYYDDTPGLKLMELIAKARMLKMRHDIQLVVIDYLQLMEIGEGQVRGNREQEVSKISRALKMLAKELNVPVIALSQLSRAVETRGGSKRPQLSDLRESGALEQDADIVTFLYRPEYYGILEDEENQSLHGVAELIFAKNRHGAQTTITLDWVADLMKFKNRNDPNFNALNPSDDESSPKPYGAIAPEKRKGDDDIPF